MIVRSSYQKLTRRVRGATAVVVPNGMNREYEFPSFLPPELIWLAFVNLRFLRVEIQFSIAHSCPPARRQFRRCDGAHLSAILPAVCGMPRAPPARSHGAALHRTPHRMDGGNASRIYSARGRA